MDAGTKVYLSWYDFKQKTEHVCKGEVVDNGLWDGTRWQVYVNVLFTPPHSAGAFCHHFTEDKLSLTPDNVPHDDCYLACGKKTRFFEHDHTVRPVPVTSVSVTWQQVQQFKQDHWDYTHGHLSVDALDEYYQMWRDAIAAKRGVTVPCDSVARSSTPPSPVRPVLRPVPVASAAGSSKKQQRSTNAIQYKDSIQTSFFD